MTSESSRPGQEPPAGPEAARPEFSHGTPRERQPGSISSTTRYLCGAAYVEEAYADAVIKNLVTDSHRAVSPALGYDTVLVIRHCLQAQRLWLTQNGILTAVLLVGLIAWPAPTVSVFVLFLLGALAVPETRRETRRAGWKVAVAVGLALVLLPCLLIPMLAGLLSSSPFDSSPFDSSPFDSGYPPIGEGLPASTDAGVAGFLAQMLVIAAAAYAAVTWSRYRMIQTITTDLARGSTPRAPAPSRREIEHRLGVIAQAQEGNIVLHADFEPFVGAGVRVDAWSVATEMKAVEEPEDEGDDDDGDDGERRRRSGPAPRVDIDPVELMTYLRKRLAALRSRDLPVQEQITGLQLRDQVVSSGSRWRGYPLIDEQVRLPYSHASPRAIESIIRYPQTSARHFLRVTVGAADKAAVADDGHTVMPAEHQSVVSSTYVHVAAEGGMLYVELVAAVLGPIQQRYLNIDAYDVRSSPLTTALGEALRRFMRATVAAPFRFVGGAIKISSMPSAIHRADREARQEPVYDFGATVDVRQLASRGNFANYLQRLDAEKYRRIINRRVIEAIEEFLTAHGIDNSDFTNKVNVYQYGGVRIAGDNYAPLAFGTGAAATATNTTVKK